MFSLLLFLISFGLPEGHAQSDEITFSREYNVDSPTMRAGFQARMRRLGNELGMQTDELEDRAANQLQSQVKLACPECQIEKHEGAYGFRPEYKVTQADGSTFNIAVDPAVVEIHSPVETNESFEAHLSSRQFVFDQVKNAGLTGAPTIPSFEQLQMQYGPLGSDRLRELQKQETDEQVAHLNIGARSAFGEDAESFVRFIADWSNRNLSAGIFATANPGALFNAPSLKNLSLKQQRALAEVCQQAQSGKIPNLRSAAHLINATVYTANPLMPKAVVSQALHFQGIGLKYLDRNQFDSTDQPFEIRGLRQPQNAAEDLLLRKLIAKRIAHVKKLKGEIIHYIPLDNQTANGVIQHLTPEELAVEFYLYTHEIGENWQAYEALIAPDVKHALLYHPSIKRLLSRKLDWASARDQALVLSILPKFYFSTWTEEWILDVMKDLPQSQAPFFKKALHQLQKKLQHSPELFFEFRGKMEASLSFSTETGGALSRLKRNWCDFWLGGFSK